MPVQPPSPRERVAVIRALLAAVDAELDQITNPVLHDDTITGLEHNWPWLDTVCPECGIKWRYVSDNCPRKIYNRHPLGSRPPPKA